MKKILLGCLGLMVGTVGFSQNKAINPNAIKAHMTLEHKRAYTGFETMPQNQVISNTGNASRSGRAVDADTAGVTTYDLQTNNALCRRIVNLGNGNIIATWTRSTSGNINANDRGTGYNYFTGGAFGPEPTDRIESERTGWPTVGVTRSGREYVITHTVSSGMMFAWRDNAGTGQWSDMIIPGDPVAVWPRAANSGDSIYVIVSRQTGDAFNGLDGGIAFFRSFDGGDNWIGPDSIPGLNASNFFRVGGDAYAIDAKDNIVAFVVGMFQPTLFKSTDYGDTWTMTRLITVSDPLYSGAVGELLDSVVSTDESYDILIDKNDMIHLWYGRNVVLDDDDATAGWTYYPFNVGVMYWNENMAGMDPVLIHQTRIANDTLVFDDCDPSFSVNQDAVQAYFGNMVSMPQAGMDDDGNIYLTFSAIRDGALDANGDMYRNSYIVASHDGGNTWVGPHNINQDDQEEAVYASIAKYVDNKCHILFQSDNIAGTAVQDQIGPAHPYLDNAIKYVAINKWDIVNPDDITCPTLSFSTDTGFVYFSCGLTTLTPDDAAIADDIPEGDISGSIQVIGTLSSTNVGHVQTVQYYVLDGAGNSSDTLDRVIKIVPDTFDKTPPVITLNGFSPVDIVVNTSYNDAGAMVTDNSGCYDTLIVLSNVDTANVGSYQVTYDATDNAGNNAVQVTRTVNVIPADTDPPVITLIGPSTLTIEVFDTYVEFGATAFDNVDLDVTANISIGGTVNTNVVGTYMVTYDVSDQAGNDAIQVVRTVHVVDLTAPEIILDGDNPLTHEKGTAYVEPGYTATDNYDGNITANVTEDQGNFDPNTAGTYTLSYSVSDSSGNSTTVKRTVNVLATPEANFTFDYIGWGGEITFHDASINGPDHWEWDFGDGSINCCGSTDPNHEYFTNGTYTVCLTAQNAIGSSTFCDDVTIVQVGIEDNTLAPEQIRIVPNPSNGMVTISIENGSRKIYEVSVFNVLGEQVNDVQPFNMPGNQPKQLDLSDLAHGIYLVKIKGDNELITQKISITGDR